MSAYVIPDVDDGDNNMRTRRETIRDDETGYSPTNDNIVECLVPHVTT
jgi:hypothetical protein